MKIFSKFKDYYDYLAHVYGEDPKIVYVRGKINKPVKVLKIEGTHGNYSNIGSRLGRVYNLELDKYQNKWLLFCGRQFLLQRHIISHPKDPIIEWTPWALAPQKYILKLKDIYHFKWRRDIIEYPDDYFEGAFFNNNLSFHKWIGKPIVTMISYDNYDEYSPVLKDIGGFVAEIPAEMAYQEISHFIMNVMNDNPDTKPPVQVNEKDRYQMHGFDLKTSFRHPVK